MPTVMRVKGFSVMIFPDDHAPAHVHVFNADGMVRVSLVGEHGPEIRTVDGMKKPDAARAERVVRENVEELLAVWNKLHGKAS